MNEKERLRKSLLGHLNIVEQSGVNWLPTQGLKPIVGAVTGEVSIREFGETKVEGDCAVAPVANVEERLSNLTLLKEKVAKCQACAELARTRKQTVFGVGRMNPEICFVGEAPGATEDEKGEPFVGEAGQLLDRLLVALGMQRAEVYICNIIRCRPPGNRLPLPVEAANCRGFLEAQLELVQPRVIVCLGACAAQNLLESKIPISKMRGTMHKWRDIPVMCTFHPAYLLRNPEKKKEVWEDMKKLMTYLGRTIPPR